MIALIAREIGVSATEYGDSITPQDLDNTEAIDRVMPIDHTPKMLGLIALMLANYLGREDITPELCCPWIDMSPEALLERATGGNHG